MNISQQFSSRKALKESMIMNYEEWQPYWEELVKKAEDNGYESLSESERIWYNTRVLIDSVSDGGIISFYYNTGADHLAETLEDLNKLKADKVIKLLLQVNKLFPGGNVPEDIDERNEIIDSWDDEKIDSKLEKLDDKFYGLEEDLEKKLEPVIQQLLNH
jgi:hypothetical protein